MRRGGCPIRGRLEPQACPGRGFLQHSARNNHSAQSPQGPRRRECRCASESVKTLTPDRVNQEQPVPLSRFCRKLHAEEAGGFWCESYIGGTAVVWATGKRYCDPPDAWHYCAYYHGPQISTDMFG